MYESISEEWLLELSERMQLDIMRLLIKRGEFDVGSSEADEPIIRHIDPPTNTYQE